MPDHTDIENESGLYRPVAIIEREELERLTGGSFFSGPVRLRNAQAEADPARDDEAYLYASPHNLLEILGLIEVDLTAGDLSPKNRIELALSRVRAVLTAESPHV